MPTRLTISGIVWAEAVEAVIAQASIADTKTHLFIRRSRRRTRTKDEGLIESRQLQAQLAQFRADGFIVGLLMRAARTQAVIELS